MAKLWPTIKKELKENKEGLLGGGAFGFIVGFILKKEGVATIMAAGEKGLIDVIISTYPAATIATVKFYFAAILIGMLIGYIVDKSTKWI